ncbi:ATP-binding protein [Pseudomonas synxantha]|uniref:ATP-binding protein n=1 Tax=Pseudomonas synxantha TaxID=47883 RepID=A0A5D3GBX1_9PSED|nr:ATP-binding protein [Pseudomonas synxantha]TYK57856.1 ATP-binding protein [Pseudomonas synxantha]
MPDLSHPGLKTYFRLNTPVLKDVVSQVFFAIAMQQTGVIFNGPSRIGKTRCSEALAQEVELKFKDVLVIRLIAVSRENARHRSTVIHQLINQEKIPVKPRDSSLTQFNMLVDRIRQRMGEQNKTQLVLIIDELQRFASADFYQLSDLVNILDSLKIKMTVVSFAMPEIVDIVNDFKTQAAVQSQLISRFMSDVRGMTGVESEKKLAQILKLYDCDMIYPEGSGITYTQHFFAAAFAQGWRISSIASVFWSEMNKKATGDYVKNLPMEHVAAVVRYFFLVRSMGRGSEDVNCPITVDDVREAVDCSGFEPFCRIATVGR